MGEGQIEKVVGAYTRSRVKQVTGGPLCIPGGWACCSVTTRTGGLGGERRLAGAGRVYLLVTDLHCRRAGTTTAF